MDDMVLIHNDKEYLRYCLDRVKVLLKKYKLEVNSKKTYISNINNGLEFLGFKFYVKHDRVIMKVKENTKNRFKKKIKIDNKLYRYNLMDNKEYKQALVGYYGHLKWGNCNYLIFKNLNGCKK